MKNIDADCFYGYSGARHTARDSSVFRLGGTRAQDPNLAALGPWRPPSDYSVERNDWRCSCDPRFDYIEIENTHNAFLYVKEMHGRGIPAAALAVVRLAKTRTTS